MANNNGNHKVLFGSCGNHSLSLVEVTAAKQDLIDMVMNDRAYATFSHVLIVLKPHLCKIFLHKHAK